MSFSLQDSYTSSNAGDNGFGSSGTYVECETFIAGSSYTITRIDLPLYKFSGSSGNVTVAVRATSGGLPTGSNLCSSSMAYSSLPASNDGTNWIEFDLGAGTALTSGTTYVILVTTTSSAIGIWRWDTSHGYANGNRVYSTNGVTYFADTSKDYVFKTYSGSSSTSVTVTPDALTLSLTLQAAVEVPGIAVPVGTLTLALSFWAPVEHYDFKVFPPVLGLSSGPQSPDLGLGFSVTPTPASVAISAALQIPIIGAGLSISPGVLTLVSSLSSIFVGIISRVADHIPNGRSLVAVGNNQVYYEDV